MDSRPYSPAPAWDRRSWPDGGVLDHVRAADGWSLRRYRLGSGARGRLLIMGGRGDMIEKFLEVIVHWAARGWAVTSFDWRGQGGSGRLAVDPLTGHIEDFGQWLDDLGGMVRAWERDADGGAKAMVGHSMGGHLLLRALAEGRVAPDAAVLVAPMLGVHSAPLPARGAWAVARLACAAGMAQRQAWTQREESVHQRRMREKRLTHDPARYADELWWRAHDPAIALGPPSWRWVERTFDSMARLQRPGVLENVATPLLLLAAECDKLVRTDAIRAAAARLPDARLHVYGPESAHEILREWDRVRLDALARIDAFLDERAP